MNRKKLLDLLSLAKPCLSEQDYIPVLGAFCFDHRAKQMTAYNGVQAVVIDDLDIGISVGFPGSQLYKALASYESKEEIEFEKRKENQYRVGTALLTALPSKDFIYEPWDIDDVKGYPIGKDFAEGLQKCLLSINSNKVLQSQHGVTLRTLKNETCLYSTDGARLSKFVLKKHFGTSDIERLLPPPFCEIVASIGKNFDEGTVYIGLDQIQVNYENISIYSKMVAEVKLLDFEKAIDVFYKGDEDFQAIPPLLKERLVLADIINPEKDGGVQIRTKKDRMLMDTKGSGGHLNPDEEEIKFELPFPTLKFYMNIQLLTQAVAAVSEITFVPDSRGEDDRAVFIGQDKNYLHILASMSRQTYGGEAE